NLPPRDPPAGPVELLEEPGGVRGPSPTVAAPPDEEDSAPRGGEEEVEEESLLPGRLPLLREGAAEEGSETPAFRVGEGRVLGHAPGPDELVRPEEEERLAGSPARLSRREDADAPVRERGTRESGLAHRAFEQGGELLESDLPPRDATDLLQDLPHPP